jgi:hypothetical protein
MAQAYTKNAWTQGALPAVDATVLNGYETGIYLASAPIVTSLPVSPVDGQECCLLADATAGVVWDMVYRSASGKWHFKGGPPLYAEIANGGEGIGGLASGVYGSPATVGPSLSFPVAGDYVVAYGFFAYFSNMSNANPVARMAPRVGNAGPDDQDSVVAAPGFTVPAGQQHMHSNARSRKMTVAVATSIVMRYLWTGQGAPLVDNRWVSVLPVRLG